MPKRRFLLAILALLSASAVNAATSGWPAFETFSWHPPRPDGKGITRVSAHYGALGFFTDRAGVYEMASAWFYPPYGVSTTLYLYTDHFDPKRPLDGLLAVSGTSRSPTLLSGLAEGAIYYLVTSSLSDPGQQYLGSVTGPGVADVAECYPGDEVDFDSAASELNCQGVLGHSYGMTAYSLGIPAQAFHRTSESVSYRFADHGPGALEVRLVDRCATSGFFWVMIFSSTARPFDVHLYDGGDQEALGAPYVSPGGTLGQPIINRIACAAKRPARPR